MTKTITIGSILTGPELELAQELGNAREICEQLIRPNLERINEKTGQENDPMYLAYTVEYALNQLEEMI